MYILSGIVNFSNCKNVKSKCEIILVNAKFSNSFFLKKLNFSLLFNVMNIIK